MMMKIRKDASNNKKNNDKNSSDNIETKER